MYAICQRNRQEAQSDRRRLRRREALHRLSTTCWPIRRSTPCTSTRRFPTTPGRSIAALKAGKHVACTVPMATTVEDCRQIVELASKTGLKYMMMETVVYSPRVSVRQGAVRQGRAGPLAVPAGQPSAGHGRLARLLGRPAADALRHALRRPVPGADRRRGGICLLLRLGPDRRGADRQIQLAVRRRNVPHQDAGLGSGGRHLLARCSTRPGNTARASTSTARSNRSSGR